MCIISNGPAEILCQVGHPLNRIYLDPVDTATLVREYYQKLDHFQKTGQDVDLNALVIPPSNTQEPAGSSDIPGRRSIGHLSINSPARGVSFGQVWTTMDCFYLVHPDQWAILRNEFGAPTFGCNVAAEWQAIVDWWRTKEDYRIKAQETTGAVQEGFLVKYQELCSLASSEMATITHRVLDAASLLSAQMPVSDEV